MSDTITLTHDGQILADWSPEKLLARGVPATAIGAALKRKALTMVAEAADTYRAALAPKSAAKLAEYGLKEEIARNPDAADPDEMSELAGEALADGIDLDALLALILAKAAAYRKTALMIGRLEAEAKAAIKAIPDDADDIAAQIKSAADGAKSQAQTAFVAAQTLINGGA